MEYAIETSSLTKRYGGKAAVNALSVHVKKGEIYGLIGRNGAGKTTLMKLLLGLTVPTSGSMTFFGGEAPEAARKRIGSIIEEPSLFRGETAYENLKRVSMLIPSSEEEIRRILELVGLSDTGKKKAGAFSLGMRQRLGLGMALIGRPEIMILDEPINGLDPAGIKEFRDIILYLNSRGVTFMISSHLLDELGKIATTFGILSNGFLTGELSADEVHEKCRSFFKIGVNDPSLAENALKACFPGLQYDIVQNELHIRSEISDLSEVNRILVENGIRVYELSRVNVDIEDFFIERMG